MGLKKAHLAMDALTKKKLRCCGKNLVTGDEIKWRLKKRSTQKVKLLSSSSEGGILE